MEGDGAVGNVALVFTKDEQVSIIAGINSGWGQAFEIDVFQHCTVPEYCCFHARQACRQHNALQLFTTRKYTLIYCL